MFNTVVLFPSKSSNMPLQRKFTLFPDSISPHKIVEKEKRNVNNVCVVVDVDPCQLTPLMDRSLWTVEVMLQNPSMAVPLNPSVLDAPEFVKVNAINKILELQDNESTSKQE